MAVKLSVLRAGHPLPPERFPVPISKLSGPQGHSAAGRIRSIKKSSDLIGNGTCDLPACSTAPQPTTLPCDPLIVLYDLIFTMLYSRQEDKYSGLNNKRLRVERPEVRFPVVATYFSLLCSVHLIPGALSQGVKSPGHEPDHSRLSSAKVNTSSWHSA
jgi:hypothetical protein